MVYSSWALFLSFLKAVLTCLSLSLTAPICILLACAYVPAAAVYSYFRPDYETSIVQRYRRPIIGLKLCSRCKAVKFSRKQKTKHYDDYPALVASARQGCWLCGVVRDQLAKLEEFKIASLSDKPEEGAFRLLIWFVQRTELNSGYLDFLIRADYHNRIYGSHPRALEPDPSSDACFSLVQGWLRDCDSLHQCYQGDGINLPTRVIDVSTKHPYLLISNGLSAPYISLSHCWGDAEPLTTTLSTINERTERIHMDTLPKMFQDAIKITRHLNIKYLWIDSICIIQDSKEDWAQEAAKMGDVYKYSFLTICVLDARDCNQGVLLPRSPRSKEFQTNESISGLEEENPWIAVEQPKYNAFKNSELFRRAWVLQERLLSTRILYYSETEIFWECLSYTARESTTKIEPYRPREYSYQRYECPDVKYRLALPPGPNPSFPLSPRTDWHIMVMEYTRCDLKVPTDKLPALSGLASISQRNSGFTYLAGLWEEDFCDGLLWHVHPLHNQSHTPSSPLPATYRAPSWSWASSDYPILYTTVIGNDYLPSRSFRDLTLQSSILTYTNANPMGEISAACATISADFQPFTYQKPPHSSRVFVYDLDGAYCGYVLLDRADGDVQTKRECAGLWITQRRFRNWDYDVVRRASFVLYFLVVVPDGGTEGAWRRVGLGRSTRGEEIFRGSEKRLVLLV